MRVLKHGGMITIKRKLTSLEALLLYPMSFDPIMGVLSYEVSAALTHSSSTSLILASQFSLHTDDDNSSQHGCKNMHDY